MRYEYDMLETRLHQASMDAGRRWLLHDVTGKLTRSWDSRGLDVASLTTPCAGLPPCT